MIALFASNFGIESIRYFLFSSHGWIHHLMGEGKGKGEIIDLYSA